MTVLYLGASLPALVSCSRALPASLAESLLLNITVFPDRLSIAHACALLSRSPPPTISKLKANLEALVCNARRSQLSSDDTLKLVYAASLLFSVESLQLPCLSLLLTALEVLEGVRPSSQPLDETPARIMSSAYAMALSSLRPNISALTESLFDVLTHLTQPVPSAIIALALLSGLSESLCARDRERLVISATKVSVKGGLRVTERVTKLCAIPLRCADTELVAKGVLPILEKALLREPEMALPAATRLLSALSSICIVSCGTNNRLFTAVLCAVRSAEDITRIQGTELASVLGLRMRGPDIVSDGLSCLCKFLFGAKYSYQRATALDAISALSCSALKKNPHCIAPVVTTLESVLSWTRRRDCNAEGRFAGVRSVTRISAALLGVLKDTEPRPTVLEGSCVFLTNVLKGMTSDLEREVLLRLLTDTQQVFPLPISFFGDEGIQALENLLYCSSKPRPEARLRALTLLCDWTDRDGKGNNRHRDAVGQNLVSNSKIPCLLVESSRNPSVSLVICILRSCGWMIQRCRRAAEIALSVLFKLCLDDRADVSEAALKQVASIRVSANDSLSRMLFSVLWRTQFVGGTTGRGNFRFYDEGACKERLGRTLLATLLPSVPCTLRPLVSLAANHPRICGVQSFMTSRTWSSRYWHIIERSFGLYKCSRSERENWLEKCLCTIFGPEGFQNEDSSASSGALNTLAALLASGNWCSAHVVQRSILYLRLLVPSTWQLSLEAPTVSHSIEDMESRWNGNSCALSPEWIRNGRACGIGQSFFNFRCGQEAPSAVGRARMPEAGGASAKVTLLKMHPHDAAKALKVSRRILEAVGAFSKVTPQGMLNATGSILSLLNTFVRFEKLEQPCRHAISTVSQTGSQRLAHLFTDISNCLYDLGNDLALADWSIIARIIGHLDGIVPPNLCVRDFSLISPIIRAALTYEFSLLSEGTKRSGSVNQGRRNYVSVVKAAVQILLLHCKPEAIACAVSAATAHAGLWLLKVLEREDGAFAVAADALSVLAGNVLCPGTERMAQVLSGLLSGKSSVRDAALGALFQMPYLSHGMECPRDSALGRTLWLSRFDPDTANSDLADQLWKNYNHSLDFQEDIPAMLGLLGHKEFDIRMMASKAIATAMSIGVDNCTRDALVSQLLSMYMQRVPMENAHSRQLGRGSRASQNPRVDVMRKGSIADPVDSGWPLREGVALAIENMACVNVLNVGNVTQCFALLSRHGLGDTNDCVRGRMSRAANAIVTAAGADGPRHLLPIIEKELQATLSTSEPVSDCEHAERTRENLVMCLGLVAEYLSTDDTRGDAITDLVIRCALETRSEVVRIAAAGCLASIFRAGLSSNREEETTESLLGMTLSEFVGQHERRGAAFALAGICRGFGLKFLRRWNIAAAIQQSLKDKCAPRRQGALIFIETFAGVLGRSFEPYTAKCLPFLLSSMGDSVVEVRKTGWAAAQATMSKISSQGAKMILPALLTGLQDRQWRTKAASAEVLGAMAFCAPRQLSHCLPQIVPKLAEALGDAHPRVVDAAESAVSRIAAVVKCPEVRNLSPFMLSALRDPARNTKGAIEAMLSSEFVHAIDAASLALLMPVLHRGLRDRSPELKKKSAAIVGSMCNNVANHHDVLPYLSILIPALRAALLDAIPDVRRTAARAFGALALSLGESNLPGVMPWLISALLGRVEILVTNTTERQTRRLLSSSAERYGAAMGLAEVSASLSEKRLDDMLEKVFSASDSSPAGREGALLLIGSMPSALGRRFEVRLARALVVVLKGLADDADNVREAALDAGRSLVSAYARSSLEHILPEILRAMRQNFWRIRLAATRLLGDMLLAVAGTHTVCSPLDLNNRGNCEMGVSIGASERTSASMAAHPSAVLAEEEDLDSPETIAVATTTDAMMRHVQAEFGTDRCNEVLAALYIIRCDVSVRVRQGGMPVWKMIVSNTPKVLREIMPSAVREIIDALGDADSERRTAACKMLGDLSQKLGEVILPEIVPALKSGVLSLVSPPTSRKGAAEGLRELVIVSPGYQLNAYTADVVDTVYHGLCDDDASVRAVCADVFSLLLRSLGSLAVDSIVPILIDGLSDETEGEKTAPVRFLKALRQIMIASGPRLLTLVVPGLLKEGNLSIAASRALTVAAEVGGTTFEPHIAGVTEAIIRSIESGHTEGFEELLAALMSCGDRSLELLQEELLSKLECCVDRRVAACTACAILCRASQQHGVPLDSKSFLEAFICQLADTDERASYAAWMVLKELSVAVPNRVLSTHIPLIRQALRSASTPKAGGDQHRRIQPLHQPNAASPFIPIFTDGLLFGEAEQREQAALAIAELVEISGRKSFENFVVKLTGPLIRVMSTHFPWQVKGAALEALAQLLNRTPEKLKAFLPQLQNIFVRSLSSRSALVRKRACSGLGALVSQKIRLDGLLDELISLSASSEFSGTRASALYACYTLLRFGTPPSENNTTSVLARIVDRLADDDEVGTAAGLALGRLAMLSTSCEQYEAHIDFVQSKLDSDRLEARYQVQILKSIGAVFLAGLHIPGLRFIHIARSFQAVNNEFESTSASIKIACCSTAAELVALLRNRVAKEQNCDQQTRATVLRIMKCTGLDAQLDVRLAALEALRGIVTLNCTELTTCARSFVLCARDKNIALRRAADQIFRGAFFSGQEAIEVHENIVLAKKGLDEHSQRFLDAHISYIRADVVLEDQETSLGARINLLAGRNPGVGDTGLIVQQSDGESGCREMP